MNDRYRSAAIGPLLASVRPRAVGRPAGRALILAMGGLLSCGGRVTSGADMGAGGTAGVGGAGGVAGSADPEFGLRACVSPRPSDELLEEMAEGESNLIVLGDTAPDPDGCDDWYEAIPYEDVGGPPASLQGLPLLPWHAVALEGGDGQVFTVQFALGELPDSLFVPGDKVTLELSLPQERGGSSLILVERDGNPLALVAYARHSLAPWASAVPDWEVEPTLQGCSKEPPPSLAVLNPMRFTANGETEVLDTAESKEVGGFLVRNAYFMSGRCAPPDVIAHSPPDPSLYGLYALQ